MIEWYWFVAGWLFMGILGCFLLSIEAEQEKRKGKKDEVGGFYIVMFLVGFILLPMFGLVSGLGKLRDCILHDENCLCQRCRDAYIKEQRKQYGKNRKLADRAAFERSVQETLTRNHVD